MFPAHLELPWGWGAKKEGRFPFVWKNRSFRWEKRNSSEGIPFFPKNVQWKGPFNLISHRNDRFFQTNGKRSEERDFRCFSRAKLLSHHFSRGQNTKNPVSSTFFAPQPHGNACYAGYERDDLRWCTQQRRIDAKQALRKNAREKRRRPLQRLQGGRKSVYITRVLKELHPDIARNSQSNPIELYFNRTQ